MNTTEQAGYEFLDEVAIADIAFRATGATLEEVFEQAARATLETMLDNAGELRASERRSVQLEEDQAELLLFDFLQELVYYKDAERLLLVPEALEIAEHGDGFRLEATLRGETITPERHHLNADVKGVTLHRFRLERLASGWQAEVVLDV